jgi:hypothetical protein
LLKKIGVPCPSQARLWCDNLGAKYTAANLVFHGRVKHIEIDYRFVWERVANGLLQIDYVPSEDQVTDGFTNALQVRALENLVQFQPCKDVIWEGMLEIRCNQFIISKPTPG